MLALDSRLGIHVASSSIIPHAQESRFSNLPPSISRLRASKSANVHCPETLPGLHESNPSVVSPSDPIHIAVVGVGFVGESLLTEFSGTYPSTGFDISRRRIAELTPKFSGSHNTRLSCKESDLASATHYLISVPTLLNPDRSVNLTFVEDAVRVVLKYARPGSSIILESSVTVGTTRRLLGPYADFIHCGMSPERVDPGRSIPAMHDIPKIVSALTPAALVSISRIYKQVFSTVIPVSKPEVAEFTKLFENCYRMVNIAYVNEMADACRTHNIDPAEMINAASTKPYGFQKFTPGLGVGGHCIPVNPFYLFANCKNLPVLERATKQMCSRPWKLAKKFHRRCLIARVAKARAAIKASGYSTPENIEAFVSNQMFGTSKSLRILVVGVAFKPGQSVISCSPGLDFARSLNESGCARLAFYDPHVDQDRVEWMEKLDDTQWTSEYLEREFDGVAVCMRQTGVKWDVLTKISENGHGPFVREYV